MFTGIIQEKVPLKALTWVKSEGSEAVLSCVFKIESQHPLRKTWNLGDSLALDGACLTITKIEHGESSSQFYFDVSKETLSKTHWANSIGKSLQQSHPRMKELHLEPALRMGDALGGHLVSGHVEGLARLESKKQDSDYLELNFSLPLTEEVAPFLISKGSVTLDGTSLTVNEVWEGSSDSNLKTDSQKRCFFKVYLIPHTLESCHFSLLNEGDFVNIESDLMARHFCRYQTVLSQMGKNS
jgi:riboflavin synthase